MWTNKLPRHADQGMHSVSETKPHGGVCVVCQIFGILQNSSINQLNYPLMNIVLNKPNLLVLLDTYSIKITYRMVVSLTWG